MRRLLRVALALALAATAGHAQPKDWGPIELVGRSVAPGTSERMTLGRVDSFAGNVLDTLVIATRGVRPGPTLCLTAGVHGDELNGVEIARRVHAETPPGMLAGTLVAVPAVNAQGLRSGDRYLPDRRDLNRAFPGDPHGSLAGRVAHAIFEEVVRRCDALLDLHTGSFARANLPQIRTDLDDPRALALARSFGVGVVLSGKGPPGSLRRAALDAGIPAVIYEAGGPLRFEEDEIGAGVAGVRAVMAHLGMLEGGAAERPSVVYRKTRWVRSGDASGIFLTPRRLGDEVSRGDPLGSVIDPVSDLRVEIHAPLDGRIIGMALPQMVLPGYALFHIGYTHE